MQWIPTFLGDSMWWIPTFLGDSIYYSPKPRWILAFPFGSPRGHGEDTLTGYLIWCLIGSVTTSPDLLSPLISAIQVFHKKSHEETQQREMRQL